MIRCRQNVVVERAPVDGSFVSNLYATRMSDRLQDLIAFVRTAERGSFSAAARDLKTTQPSVSRMVSTLEERLGVKLLLRTTRRVVPTEAGAILLERGHQLLDDLDAAEDATRGINSLRGVLRLGLSGAFGHREVIPRLPHFLQQYPDLSIELQISVRAEDLVAEGADMALRLGVLQDSGFGSRRLAATTRHVVATSAYLNQHGTPAHPTDLVHHDCIVGPGHDVRRAWAFREGGTVISVQVKGRAQVATAEGVIACAKAGLGIGLASLWMCRAELEARDLVTLLPGFGLEPVEVHAVYPSGRRPSAKVRIFSEFLAAALSQRSPEG